MLLSKWHLSFIRPKKKEQIQKQIIEDSEHRYRQLFENHTAVELIIDLEEGNIVDANKSAVAFYGYSKAQLLKKKIYEINLLSHEEIQKAIKHAKQTKRSFFEFQHRLADGSIKDVNVFTSTAIINEKEYMHSIIFDVTNHLQLQKRYIAELEASKKLYQLTLKNMPIGIAVNKISSGEMIIANDHFYSIYRTDKKSLTGLENFWETVYKNESFRQKIKSRILSDIQSGDPEKMRWENVPIEQPDKKTIAYVSAYNIPVVEQDLMISTVIDVTDINQAKNEALYWHGFFQYILRYNLLPVAVFDRQMRYIFTSNSYLEAYDLLGKEVLGKKLYDLFPEIPDRLKKVHQRALKGEDLSSDHDFFTLKDGSILFTRWTYRPWFDMKGEIGGIIFYAEVIAKKGTSEKGDYERQSPSKFILNTLNDVAITLNNKGLITGIYGKGLEKINLSVHDCLGKNYTEHMPGSPKGIHEIHLQKALAGEETTYEWQVIHNKESLYFETTLYPYTNDDNQTQIIIGFIKDQTQLKKAQLEKESQLKEQELLVKELYHRIKNNLIGIKGIIDLKLGDQNPPETVEVLEDIKNRLENMQLIYDKLSISKNSNVMSQAYIDELVHILIETRKNFGVKVVCNLENHALNAKKMYAVGMIINELTTNALKYAFEKTQDNQIVVNFFRINDQFTLEVADNGKGLPKHINTKRNNCLGLTLVNMLTEQLQGSCIIKRDNGTQFTITFPA